MKKSLTAIFIVCFVVPNIFAQTNFVLTTETCEECNQQQLEDWEFVSNNMLGVTGRDPVSHKIGIFAATRGIIYGKNWYPADIYKHTLIGTLDHFNFHDPWGDEADWNNYIIPDPPFTYLITDLLPLRVVSYDLFALEWTDAWHDCGGVNDCLEAEITPDEHFYANPWFNGITGQSLLEGKKIGTYGPWVYEEVHGNRPEIHVSELYWWRANNNKDYYLMLLQDDSNRFDRPEDYDITNNSRPAWWRPWSAYPRTGEFKIAFELNPNDTPFIFDINNVYPYTRNVVTGNDQIASLDADDSFEHAIEYNGKVVLVAREEETADQAIGVQFVEVCRNRQNTRLQGYIKLTSKVGRDDRGQEGYHVIKVSKKQQEITHKRVHVTFLEIKQLISGTDNQISPVTFSFKVNEQLRQYNANLCAGSSVNPNVNISIEKLRTLDDLQLLMSAKKGLNVGDAKATYNYENNFGEGQHNADISIVTITGKPDPRKVPTESDVKLKDVFYVNYRIDVENIIESKISSVVVRDPSVATHGRIIKDSLRRVFIDGKSQLVADVEVALLGGKDTKDADLKMLKAELVANKVRQPLTFQPIAMVAEAKQAKGVIKSVPIPMVSASRLEFTMKSGVKLGQNIPAISLSPKFAADTQLLSNVDTNAWNAMVTAIGGKQVPSQFPAQLINIREWQLDIEPGYAPIRAGMISPGEDSPVSEELNDIIRRNDKVRMADLFGTSQPFKLEWTFEARNLTSGTTVPVKVDQVAEANEVKVELLQGKLANGRIKISFPRQPANAIYELTGTANMTDIFSNAGTVQHHIWSHVLSGEDEEGLVEALLPAVADFVGISASDLVTASRLDNLPDEDRIVKDPHARRARLVRLTAMRVAQDKTITVAELRCLIDGAKLFGGN